MKVDLPRRQRTLLCLALLCVALYVTVPVAGMFLRLQS